MTTAATTSTATVSPPQIQQFVSRKRRKGIALPPSPAIGLAIVRIRPDFYGSDTQLLSDSMLPPVRHGANTERRVLLAEVEEKLKEYNTLLESFLGHLERPEPEEPQIKSVINWMDGKKPLTRAKSTFLNDWSDLKRPRQSGEKGGLEVFLGWCAASPMLCGICKVFSPPASSSKSEDPHIQLLRQSRITSASRTLTTTFAVFTLVIPITVLYNVETIASRLWVITGFTAIFSSALCWLTSSRNYEIFSATAAYCAVMVVFVGSLPGC
ncbi:Fc.00g088390.m01.CDS01 [Cosmosporella sp. VM-42]